MAKILQSQAIRFALVSAVVLGRAMLGLGWFHMRESHEKDFWVEVSKAGIQTIVVAAVGVLVTAAVEFAAHQREELRQRNDYLLGLIRRLRANYSAIKRARRRLEAAGFRASRGHVPGPSVAAYHEALMMLSDAKLDLEAMQEELEAGAQILGSWGDIWNDLERITKYLDAQAIDEYRRYAFLVLNAPESLGFELFPRVKVFASDAGANAAAFGANVATPYHDAIRALESAILGLATPATGTAPLHGSMITVAMKKPPAFTDKARRRAHRVWMRPSGP